MYIRTVVGGVATFVILSLGACDSPSEPIGRIDLAPLYSVPSRDDTSGSTDFASIVSSANGNEELWAGETVDELTSAYVCPPWVDRPHFDHKTHHYRHEHRVYRVAIIGQVGSIPKARYHLATSTLSDDGTRQISPGDLDGSCFVRLVRSFAGLSAYMGYMAWYKFWGSEGPASGPSGSGSRGWGYYSSATGATSGAGDGSWITAVETWLSSGACTVGWEIWVDGDMVCDSRGVAV